MGEDGDSDRALFSYPNRMMYQSVTGSMLHDLSRGSQRTFYIPGAHYQSFSF